MIADAREHPGFSVFAGPVSNLDPVGELDCAGLLSAVREGQHPVLGDWRGALPTEREARNAVQRRRPYTTPNCILRRRDKTGFVAFSGCIFADLDDALNAPAIRDAVAAEPSCLCAWVSASGKGVHTLHRCEQRRTPADHRRACEHLRRRLLALGLQCEIDLCGKVSRSLCSSRTIPVRGWEGAQACADCSRVSRSGR